MFLVWSISHPKLRNPNHLYLRWPWPACLLFPHTAFHHQHNNMTFYPTIWEGPHLALQNPMPIHMLHSSYIPFFFDNRKHRGAANKGYYIILLTRRLFLLRWLHLNWGHRMNMIRSIRKASRNKLRVAPRGLHCSNLCRMQKTLRR